MQNPNQGTFVNESNKGLQRFYTKVYGYMAFGVGISAVISYLMLYVYKAQFFNFIGTHTMVFYGLIILELVFVVAASATSFKNPALAMTLFIAYAVVNGLTISLILSMYSTANIAAAFITSVAVFGSMAIYGSVSKKDLSKIGQMAFAALIGVVVASLVNMFLQNAMVDYIFSYITVIVFIGLTMWDAQKLKNLYLQYGNQMGEGLAINGALTLYLDFINIFLSMLRIFGGSSRD